MQSSMYLYWTCIVTPRSMLPLLPIYTTNIIIIGPALQCLNSAIQQVNNSQVDIYFQELHF